jgi:hypothetical protein
VVGPVTDNTISAILKPEASLEVQVAVSYLRGEGSELDCLGYPLTGQVGGLYEVVSADALYAGRRATVLPRRCPNLRRGSKSCRYPSRSVSSTSAIPRR